jgi:hypothetical protein
MLGKKRKRIVGMISWGRKQKDGSSVRKICCSPPQNLLISQHFLQFGSAQEHTGLSLYLDDLSTI